MRYLLLLCCFLFVLEEAGYSQGIPSDGREYYVGLVTPAINSQPLVFNISARSYLESSVLVSAIAETKISISIINELGIEGDSYVYHLAAFTSKQIQLKDILSQSPDLHHPDEHVVLHLISSSPATVTAITGGICSGGSYLCLPLQCLGKKYVLASYRDNPSGIGGIFNTEPSAGFGMIIATENETHVTLTPSVTTSEGLTGVSCGNGSDQKEHPVDLLLNRGQSYYFKSAGTDGECDLSGTVISANKPIAVLGGHENAYIDNSDIEDYVLEERDFMIEQMIPYECWGTGGYMAFPFYKQENGSIPNEVHIINDGITDSSIIAQIPYTSARNITISPFQEPVHSEELDVPTWFTSTSGKPFMVMQYLGRSQNVNHASPSPSMMNIIPEQCWKNNFRISIPWQTDQPFNANFIAITYDQKGVLGNITVSKNGGPMVPLIQSGLLLKKHYDSYRSFLIYEIPPGEYYFENMTYNYFGQGGVPFMIYTFSYRSKDIISTSSSQTKAYYSNANPAGMAYKDYRYVYSDYQYVSYTIVDKCDHWEVEVWSPSGAKIKYVSITNEFVDVITNRYRRITSKNVEIYDKNGIAINNEVICKDSQSSVVLNIKKMASGDSSSAVIAVYDIYGNKGLLPVFEEASIIVPAFKGVQTADSVHFSLLPTGVHQSRAGKISIAYSEDYHLRGIIHNVHIKGDTSVIHIIQDSSSLPLEIEDKSNATIAFRFTPQDTLTYSDTIVIITDCPEPIYYYISAKGEWSQIDIPDYAFEETLVGSKKLAEASFTNTGNIPFQLQRVTLSDDINFKIDTTYNHALPITLLPGTTSAIKIQFTPKSEGYHTTLLNWETDIPSDNPLIRRSFSILSGTGKSKGTNEVTIAPSIPEFQIARNKLIVSTHQGIIKKVSLYDLTAREVVSSVGTSETLEVSIIALSHGIYTAVAITDSGIRSQTISF